MGEFADSIGVPTLAGSFIMSGVAFIIAGLILLIFLRPDPLFVSAGGALSGMVVTHSSYTILSISGAVLSLLLIPIVIWYFKGNQVKSEADIKLSYTFEEPK